MKLPRRHLIISICLLVILVISFDSQSTAFLNDPAGDTASDEADILQVTVLGSSILIDVAENPTIGSGVYYLVLLDGNGDPSNFEAAIMLELSATESVVTWIVGSPSADTTNWIRSNGQFTITSNGVSLYFDQYSELSSSEQYVLAIDPSYSGYDWAPDISQHSVNYRVFEPFLDGNFVTPGTGGGGGGTSSSTSSSSSSSSTTSSSSSSSTSSSSESSSDTSDSDDPSSSSTTTTTESHTETTMEETKTSTKETETTDSKSETSETRESNSDNSSAEQDESDATPPGPVNLYFGSVLGGIATIIVIKKRKRLDFS